MSRILRSMLERSLGQSSVPFSVTFVDGSVYRNSQDEPAFSITFRRRSAELNVLVNHGWGLLESYFNETLDIDGSLVHLIRAADETGPSLAANSSRRHIPHPLIRLRNLWHEIRFANRTIGQARRNARFHYNRGTDMFRHYLDTSMTYTCAYWKEGTGTLDEAQQNKLDHVCRKLRLRPGDRLIDVGGGWGSLLIHACEHYGVSGTNVSVTPDQNRWMAEEVARRGLTEKIVIEEKDFRQIGGHYDRYISLGVVEHAGKGALKAWIRGMAQCLNEGGMGLLQFIAHDRAMDTDFFIRKHIFPGGYLPGLSEVIDLMASFGLEILDIENLRRHYALTLDAWAANFDGAWQSIHRLDPQRFDERFRRIWRTYLHVCAEYFRADNTILRLYQVTFSKGNTTDYPMDRGFLYH